MLFLAIYLAIQIEYILLATFRSEAVYRHVCVKLHLECWDWFLCGVLGLLLMKKSFGFNLAFGCACQRSHFLSDFAVCQTEVSFYCFLSGFGTITPCSLLSFAPGGVLSWAAGKQRHCLWLRQMWLWEWRIVFASTVAAMFSTCYRRAPLPPLILAD